jgi:hypothetical protein
MKRIFYFLKQPATFTDIMVDRHRFPSTKLKPEYVNLVCMYQETENPDEPKVTHWGGKEFTPVEAIEATELEANTQEAIEALLRLYPNLYCYGVAMDKDGYREKTFSMIDDVTLECFLHQTDVPTFSPYEIECFERFWVHNSADFQGTPKAHARGIYLLAQRILRNKMLFKAQEMLTRPQTHPTKAILEAMQNGGLTIPETHTYEAMVDDSRKQFEEAFPLLAQK